MTTLRCSKELPKDLLQHEGTVHFRSEGVLLLLTLLFTTIPEVIGDIVLSDNGNIINCQRGDSMNLGEL